MYLTALPFRMSEFSIVYIFMLLINICTNILTLKYTLKYIKIDRLKSFNTWRFKRKLTLGDLSVSYFLFPLCRIHLPFTLLHINQNYENLCYFMLSLFCVLNSIGPIILFANFFLSNTLGQKQFK